MTSKLTKTSFVSYYERFRSDVIAAVPSNAKYILSVGCAAGATEAELIKRGIKVVGIEINPKAAEIARQRGLVVLEGNAAEVDIDVDGYYDCLIYADVLEHLPDPFSVLKGHIDSLKHGGTIYVCVPNFRHYSIFWQLFVRGKICYDDAGILDRTHFRMTTKKMIADWFKQIGIETMSIKYIIHRRRDKLISSIFLGSLKEFIAEQVGIIGKKL